MTQSEAAFSLAEHLIERGRLRIAFAGAQLDPRMLQRLNGRRKTLSEAGLYDTRLEWLHPAPSSLELRARMFEQIMSVKPSIDAIFFCNDDLVSSPADT